MSETSEAPKSNIISRTVKAVRSWGEGVVSDAKAAPGLVKDVAVGVAKNASMTPSGDMSNSWRTPGLEPKPVAPAEQPATPQTPTPVSK